MNQARIIVGLFASLAALHCNAILGIEERTLVEDSDPCASYCDAVKRNCDADSAGVVYGSNEACQATCEAFKRAFEANPTVVPSDPIACRAKNANDAGSTGETTEECSGAGPAGKAQCGTSCEAYCLLMSEVCSDYIESVSACITDCAQVPDDVPYEGKQTPAGNSLSCRLYHVTAASLDSAQHCAHAAGQALCVAQ